MASVRRLQIEADWTGMDGKSDNVDPIKKSQTGTRAYVCAEPHTPGTDMSSLAATMSLSLAKMLPSDMLDNKNDTCLSCYCETPLNSNSKGWLLMGAVSGDNVNEDSNWDRRKPSGFGVQMKHFFCSLGIGSVASLADESYGPLRPLMKHWNWGGGFDWRGPFWPSSLSSSPCVLLTVRFSDFNIYVLDDEKRNNKLDNNNNSVSLSR